MPAFSNHRARLLQRYPKPESYDSFQLISCRKKDAFIEEKVIGKGGDDHTGWLWIEGMKPLL
jgi:hypothetical protein